MRFFTFVLLSVISYSAFAMTLSEAVKMALQNSSSLKQQELELQKSDHSLTQATSAFLPSLDLKASYLYLQENPQSRVYDWDSSASLVLTENLYDHGVSLTNYRASKARQKITLLDYRREKSSAILKVTQLYFEALKSQKVRALQDKNLELVEKGYNLIQSQYKNGVRTRQDFLRFESQYQRALLAKSTALYDEERALDALKLFLNISGDLVIQDWQKQISAKKSDGPVYESEKRQLTQDLRQYEENLLKIENRPQLDLFGKWGYGSDSYFHTQSRWSDNDKTFWSVGVNFTWNLWDWGQRSSAVQIATLESRRQDIRFSYDEREVHTVLKSLESRIQLNRRQLELADKILKVETENFSLLERDFRAGQTSYLTYSTSLTDLISAQIQKIQSDYNLLQSLLELEHRKGYLDETSL